ncbi:hypothetical protein [Pontimicrobium sp. MEBiC01747]
MITKYYSGNHSLTLGQPFVLISADEQEKEFYAEKFIVFESYDGITLIANSVNYPKVDGQNLNEFIKSELEITKDDIIHKIIYAKFEKQLERLNYDFKIDLIESDSGILSLLRNKFPEELNSIKNKTSDPELIRLIKMYQSFRIFRTDL